MTNELPRRMIAETPPASLVVTAVEMKSSKIAETPPARLSVKPNWNWFIASAEEQAIAVLQEHNCERWQDVKPADPEPLRMASKVLRFAMVMRDKMENGDFEEAAICAFQCGFFSGLLPKANELQKKLSRTKEAIVEKIRELRAQGITPANIAELLNKWFKKKSGKPYNENDVRQYMRRHGIE